MHADVEIGNERRQIVRHRADSLSRVSPMNGYAHLVNRLAVDDQRLHPRGDHRAGLNRTTPRSYNSPSAVFDPAFLRQLGIYLEEHLRLQFVEPAVETAHGS